MLCNLIAIPTDFLKKQYLVMFLFYRMLIMKPILAYEQGN